MFSTDSCTHERIYLLRPRNDLNTDWSTSSLASGSSPSTSTGSMASSNVIPSATPSTTISSTNLPSPSPSVQTPTHTSASPLGVSSGSAFTTSFPVTTVTKAATTFTISILSTTSSMFSTTSAEFSTASAFRSRAGVVCPGTGFDSAATGILSVVIVPSTIGLILWLLFAILRPRFRQVYALREWFVQQECSPAKPLGSSFLAFLFPKVPLIPAVPTDVSNAGRSAVQDAKLFPSDEELSQRSLWVALLIALGWSVLALAGALPLYLVNTPCNANQPSPAVFGETLSGPDPSNVHIRVIVLTVLTILVGLLPALIKIIKEFNKVVDYRRRWLEVKCEGKDLGWLSARKAPGLQHGRKAIGLSSSLGDAGKRNGGVRPRNGERRTRRREEEQPLHQRDDLSNAEIDIRVSFQLVCRDTHKLALLIDEQTKYISSFRVTTPDPSVLDFVPVLLLPPTQEGHISAARFLSPLQKRRSRPRRHMNHAYAASSLAPSSFVAPSSYYKLRGVSGVNGGKFADSNAGKHQSLADSINSRVIGSRFMEVNRNSAAHVAVEKSGELGPAEGHESWLPPIPDPRLFGPNYGLTSYDDMHQDEEWYSSDFNGIPPDQAGPSSFLRRPRPRKDETPPSTHRDTFPLRNEAPDPDSVPPPHLRLQPSQPFVRPLDGLGFDDLGDVYAEITQWRSRLKIINADIAEAQRESYNDIASGTGINGWLMVGRGLRFIPGIQMIEGRAKEDIRWDVLQNERTGLDSWVLWSVVTIVSVILAVALTAAVGLFLAPAPDVAHYIPFFQPLVRANTIAAGIATILAPTVAATIFIIAGLWIIYRVATIHGSISISGNQLLVFKITFFVLTVVGTIWLVAIGAILFSMQALNTHTAPTETIANGSVFMSILCLALIINVAIIFPALLLLQPLRLWRVLRAEKQAVTPRQRFRAVYPRTYDPSFAIGACVLAIVFASTFALIFPLIAPAVVILLLLTLIAHRFLVGYVYARTHSQTGGLLQIWLLRRFGTLLSFQPILLGLIVLSLRFWIEGGILLGTGAFVILFVEVYTNLKTRLPGQNSLSPITQNSLETFTSGAERYLNTETDTVNGSSLPGNPTRGSMASVLEMMSVTLAVMPSSSSYQGAVPLHTETLDDLTATERAARTHPDAPPLLPPLPFTDHAEDMAGIMYAPELIAPPPIIWLPNDLAGVARSEAVDLQKYHNLQVTLDVRAKEDVIPRISTSSRRPSR
ncbi:hypothetical protein CPB84DRAFT_1764373 [Gymnopilus junonius]|uniref:CSC1/OSCA1-like 7TM region domain-containing protein n=1 Tax=Gymnopilus junonius TaxID=109634 RepID=A0A9P5NXN7_GYMJU|nr:hypothetical protein CPB84DRAFT_1764373 [Gymnopilus junonius]